MAKYSEQFYEKYELGVERSARTIVPMILDLLSPRSVVDLGCGTGGWLAEFRSRGIEDIFGLDGDWLPTERLKIPSDKFRTVDLHSPGVPSQHFDLAVCLEVAEHVDEGAAVGLVAFLVAESPFVLFSAAVPGQGGTGHVNEQWLDYWEKIFDSFGYSLFDPIRAAVWDNPSVEPWYAQNVVVFADRRADAQIISKLAAAHSVNSIPVKAIHPLLRSSVYD